MCACLKQHGLESALRLLSTGSNEMEGSIALVDAIFTRINGLERRLQVVYPEWPPVTSTHIHCTRTDTHTYTRTLYTHRHAHIHTYTSFPSLLFVQALAELERNWWHDVGDIVEGNMGPNEAFFFSLLQQEVISQ